MVLLKLVVMNNLHDVTNMKRYTQDKLVKDFMLGYRRVVESTVFSLLLKEVYQIVPPNRIVVRN